MILNFNKMSGRQRFKTISTQRRSVLTLHAKVQILADHIPPRLYDSMGRLRDPFKFGSHPSWLYKHHDVYAIMKSIKVEVRSRCFTFSEIPCSSMAVISLCDGVRAFRLI